MKLAIVLSLAVILFAGFCFVWITARPYIWFPLGSAKVTMTGGTLRSSKVYRSQGGWILVHLKYDENNEIAYTYYPASKTLGIPSVSQFIFRNQLAISKEYPPSVVFADDRVKVEDDPGLIVEERALEFSTLDHQRVKIELDEPVNLNLPNQ